MKKLLIFIFLLTYFSCVAQKETLRAKEIILSSGMDIIANTTIETQSSSPSSSHSKLSSTNLIKVISDNVTVYKISSEITKINSSSDDAQTNYDFISNSQSDLDIKKNLPKRLISINKGTGKLIVDPLMDSLLNPKVEFSENPIWEQFGQNVIESAFFLVPINKTTGDSWLKIDSSINSKSNTTYTVLYINKDSTKIDFIGETNVDKIMQVQDMQVSIKSKSILKGQIWINNKNNLVSKKITTTNTDSKIDVMGQTSYATSITVTTNTFFVKL